MHQISNSARDPAGELTSLPSAHFHLAGDEGVRCSPPRNEPYPPLSALPSGFGPSGQNFATLPVKDNIPPPQKNKFGLTPLFMRMRRNALSRLLSVSGTPCRKRGRELELPMIISFVGVSKPVSSVKGRSQVKQNMQ